MSNVRAILTPDPPSVLYHYTGPAGLLGIIEKREIWASHTQYLNDQREFRHAVGIIEEEISSMKKAPEHKEHQHLLNDMLTILKDTESMNVCVCSFSEDGDILSQWRAYCVNGGFSIGFAGPFLRAISEQQRFWLVKCVYEEEQQRALMRTLLIDVLNENTQKELAGHDDDLPITGGNLGAYLNRYAPILKHKSFAEEKEWRIISRPLSCTRDGFSFRSRGSMLIPYYKIPLTAENHSLDINRIVIGPTPHSRQSRRSVQSLLVKHNLRNMKVENTEAPYRNW